MADRDKIKGYMEGEYLPTPRASMVEDQIANALDYIAYHIGRIDQTLRDTNATLKEISMKIPR